MSYVKPIGHFWSGCAAGLPSENLPGGLTLPHGKVHIDRDMGSRTHREGSMAAENELPMRIVIADDHALVRGGIGILIKTLHPGTELVECNNLERTLKVLSEPQPIDLLLIDLMMPGMDLINSIQQICSTWPDVPVVVVSVREDMQIIRQTLRAGAVGYIPKTSSPDVTMNAIRLVLSGGIYIPPDALDLGARAGEPALSPEPAGDAEEPMARDKATGLTRRQLDVLDLIAEGKSNKEIAVDLDLTAGTIKMHLSRIYKVLKAKSRTEAVARYNKLKRLR